MKFPRNPYMVTVPPIRYSQECAALTVEDAYREQWATEVADAKERQKERGVLIVPLDEPTAKPLPTCEDCKEPLTRCDCKARRLRK